ncbi:unnamed protein product [Menidia menidia]|uniref:(Atlantic silverside) hypothetical protein n=1 Tax=Menidia menidia TaxID=238744 RepID=A0A8S4ABD8_9TELE|nr:unnamed protein product [Menidia menidia]
MRLPRSIQTPLDGKFSLSQHGRLSVQISPNVSLSWEITSAVLWRASLSEDEGTPLLVRSSSDSALGPQTTETQPPFTEDSTGMRFGSSLSSGSTLLPGLKAAELQETDISDPEIRRKAAAVEVPEGPPLMKRGTLQMSVSDSLTGQLFSVCSLQAVSPAGERPAAGDCAHTRPPPTTGLTRTVEILGEDSPLGIHVVPYCSSLSGRSLGLYIRGVEEESRSKKEGLFQEDECIVKINNTDLMDKTFNQAQDLFRSALHSQLVCLEVVPSSNRDRYEKSLIGQLFGSSSGPNSSPQTSKAKEPPPPVKAKPVFKPPASASTQPAEEPASEDGVSSPKGRSESPHLRKSPALSNLVSNKKGRRLRIDLKKGSEGLGFTVVTRDSSVHGPGPILVKNILPRGAAVRDGRLQSGDRILEVNGMDIAGVCQEELVCMLRGTRQGDSVSLVVLRQEDMFLPREMKDEVSSIPGFVLENGKEHLMFEVPLNDTGSAGLGISLKGNKSRETGEDLGIFINRCWDVPITLPWKPSAAPCPRRGTSGGPSSSWCCGFPSSTGLLGGMSPLKCPTGLVSPASESSQPPLVTNAIYASSVTNGSSSYMDEEEEEGLCGHVTEINQPSCFQDRGSSRTGCPAQPQAPSQNQRQIQHIKASKSMDLGTSPGQPPNVADESNLGPQDGGRAAASTPVELGPTLGLKKSSSLESLQTAMSEVNRKNELLPFHRPRPNMVRGRGCNESFRAAIDKSYDGPAEDDEGRRHEVCVFKFMHKLVSHD